MVIDKALKKTIVFHSVLNIVFALLITLSSYVHIPLSTLEGKLMYVVHLCIVQASFAGIIYLLSLNRVLFKLVFSLLFLVLSFIAFWVYTINISVSEALLEATFTTKGYIIKDLFSWPLIAYIILVVLILLLILKQYKHIQPKKGAAIFIPLSVILIGLFFYADYKRSHSFRSKLPYALLYSTVDYLTNTDLQLKRPPTSVEYNPTAKLKVVFVLGESLRGDHLGLNGYHRQTTPLLAKRENLVSFKNIYTDKGNTALSLPCILTDKSIYTETNDSILSVFTAYKALQIPTYWIGNQLLETSYKPIVETNSSVEIIDKLKSYWNVNKKQDLELLPVFKDKLKATTQGLFTLHMIGSHWWYEDKYTDRFRQFKPVIDSKYIPSLEKEEIINSYDNTILYLDYFLDSVINILEEEQEPTVLVFLADHGESLGENGRWLHSHSEGLTMPGMLVWYSESFKQLYPKKVAAVIKNKAKAYTTDFLFHSLLDVTNASGFNIEKAQSVFYNAEVYTKKTLEE